MLGIEQSKPTSLSVRAQAGTVRGWRFRFMMQLSFSSHVGARERVRLAKRRTAMKIWYIGVAAIGALIVASPALGQISDDLVKIGVLSNQTAVGAGASGVAAATAARLAVEDFGGTVRGKPIQVIDADFGEKPDLAATIARRWYDTEKVDAIADMPVSSAALAVQEITRNAKKTLLVGGAVTSDLTGKACSPYTTHWTDDSYSLGSAVVQGTTKGKGTSWFFVAVDYALGASLQRDATAAIQRLGGRVIGGVRYPLGVSDLASFLLQAQASRASIIGLASVGQDTVNAVKQAHEFGLQASGQELAAFLVFITDVDALGLEAAQGLHVAEGFYWDQNEQSRRFAQRMFARHKRMPTKEQAAVYASVSHYLKAIDAISTDDAGRVNRQMREMPVDYFGRPGSIREDGRVLYDMTLYQVKSPAQSKYAWDFYNAVRTLPKEEVFRPGDGGGCSIAAR
jgi:branched-chain amino acid transport system substrate-binding protein